MKVISRHFYRRAFTIVELLVIISVIGILAAISVVSYNGIQERARSAAAIDGANQAADLLEAFQLKNNGLYPATGNLAAAEINDTGSLSYQYTQTSGGTNYCVTATNKNISYKITQDAAPTPGACPGHGANGIMPITNLAINPSLESQSGSWGGSSSTGTVNITTPSGTAVSGSRFLRLDVTSGSGGAGGAYVTGNAVTADKAYTASVSVKSSPSKYVRVAIVWLNAGGSTISTTYGTAVVIGSVNWTRISFTNTAPANAVMATARFDVVINTLNTGESLSYDAFMFTEGSTLYNFADGNSPGWSWKTITDYSASDGPPL